MNYFLKWRRGVDIVLELLTDISAAFLLGLLTPLTAVCVLPLYPAFLSYLANQLSGRESDKKTLALFGVIITFGVVLFMLILGLIFTTLLEISLTHVIGIVSPIAFGILIIISLLLIFDIDVGKFLPRIDTPTVKNPLMGAFVYGFFFGAIVVPCNPLFIAALFARSVISMDFVSNLITFIFFGIGIGFPLLVFSLISQASSATIIKFLVQHKRRINVTTGIIMLVVSLYYVFFVFKILGG